jgi:hypothetical protein
MQEKGDVTFEHPNRDPTTYKMSQQRARPAREDRGKPLPCLNPKKERLLALRTSGLADSSKARQLRFWREALTGVVGWPVGSTCRKEAEYSDAFVK